MVLFPLNSSVCHYPKEEVQSKIHPWCLILGWETDLESFIFSTNDACVQRGKVERCCRWGPMQARNSSTISLSVFKAQELTPPNTSVCTHTHQCGEKGPGSGILYLCVLEQIIASLYTPEPISVKCRDNACLVRVGRGGIKKTLPQGLLNSLSSCGTDAQCSIQNSWAKRDSTRISSFYFGKVILHNIPSRVWASTL